MFSRKILKWRIKILGLRMMGKKRVALASFPRSGNTWMRFMIEEATGLQSGSIYKDRVLTRESEGVVIKTHARDSYRYTHAIHIIRNPFDAITSFFYWKRDIEGRSVIWEEHVKKSVEMWRLHTEHWLAVKKPVLRIRYEDLRAAPQQELSRVVNWLGIDIADSKIESVVNQSSLKNLRQVEPKLGEKFFRKGQTGTGVAQFSESDKYLIISGLQNLLSQVGYQ